MPPPPPTHNGSKEKHAEEDLRIQSHYLATILHTSPDGFWVVDTHQKIVEVNVAYCAMSGYARNELLGMSIHDIDADENPVETMARIERIVQNGSELFETRHFRKDRSIWPVEISATWLNEHGGWFVCFCRDLTQRKKWEERISLLAHMLDSAPASITIHDTEGRFYFANRITASMHGYDNEVEFLAVNLNDLDVPESQALLNQRFRQIMENGETRFESTHFRKDGSTFPLEILAKLIDLDGRPAVLSIGTDITERKQAEQELRKRENQLEKIFEILPIGLWFADQNGTLVRGNPMGVKIWGAEPKVPISQYGVFKAKRLPSRETIQPDDWALAKTIRKGLTIVDELLEIETFDGKKKIILNYSAPVMDSSGHVDGAIVVNLDITERHHLEEQLRQAQKMESVGRLAGGVAHDFNNMLSVILGNTELALDTLAPEDPSYERFQEIRTASRRSADITRQLLAFARKQTISPQVIDLNQTVEGMLRMIRRLIREEIHLSWQPGPGLWPICMDPSQIHQILVNLCVNAVDAISGAGEIIITTQKIFLNQDFCTHNPGLVPGDYVLLDVGDNGCGMDEETMDNLFEPFFTTKDVNKGTGLGLSTVYGIVKQNNGFLTVHSRPHEGTTLKIYLPRHETPITKLSPQEKKITRARDVETILLMEDEQAVMRITEMILKRLGYSVMTAKTFDEAMKKVKSHNNPINLLITDVIMPEMNGRDLAETLTAFYPDLKVLFMSGYTADVIAHHGVLDDGVHFIQKPFSKNQIAAKIREIIDAEQSMK